MNVIPHVTLCQYCGEVDYRGFENFAHYVQKDESGGSCQTWVMTQGSWVWILYKEW